jgi:3-hydroxybutyryl-CoA dehydrogenase
MVIDDPRTIGICGLGQIGLALGLACYRSGYRVLLYGRNHMRLAPAQRELLQLDEWMRREFPEQRPKFGEIEFTSVLSDLNDEADLIVEGIAEDLEAKIELLSSFEGAAARGAIFCSSTSGLSISEMGRRTGFGSRLAGTHFWNPPHLMPLVEVIAGAETSEKALDIAIAFCRRIGKRPVRVNVDAPGFIGNRLLHAMWREAIDIVERGIAAPEDVDLVAKMTFGLRLPVLGPLENMDLVGLDLIHRIHEYLLPQLANNTTPGKLLQEMVSKRNLGMKSGSGFYDWSNRNRNALVENRDRQIIRELRRLGSEKGLSGTD